MRVVTLRDRAKHKLTSPTVGCPREACRWEWDCLVDVTVSVSATGFAIVIHNMGKMYKYAEYDIKKVGLCKWGIIKIYPG